MNNFVVLSRSLALGAPHVCSRQQTPMHYALKIDTFDSFVERTQCEEV